MSSVNKFSVGMGERIVTRILVGRQNVTFPRMGLTGYEVVGQLV